VSTNDAAQIAADFKAYISWWLRGTLDDLGDLADEILTAHQTRFPWLPAIEALAAQPIRRLWRALENETLQDLYDVGAEAGLEDVAEAFATAILSRPYIDDGKTPPEVRELVMRRDGRRCQSCGSAENLTLDHKYVAWSDGGSSDDPANLQVLCRSCNSSKGIRPWTDEEAAA
jgi:hypothetical protein